MSERGDSTPEIEVSFDLDANCIMNVSASDKSSKANNITPSPTTQRPSVVGRDRAHGERLSG
jgi:molecular chaperone DnaK (HSP70)